MVSGGLPLKSPHLFMKSLKRIKSLEEVVEPFTFTPKRSILGGVNGQSFYFPAHVQATLTLSQFDAIIHSEYSDELKN